jgi:hypothetical protein
MGGARKAAKKGLDVSLSAMRHAGWWLEWQTNRHACRQAAELRLLRPPAASTERPAA